MSVLSVSDIDVRGKKVFVRVDFNVPQDEAGTITDDTRIRESLATIHSVIDRGGKAILASHLGRPKGKRNEKYTLRPVAERLAELLGVPVRFAPDCVGEEVQQAMAQMHDSDVLLLENVRFYAEEEANDSAFAARLASGIDVYVNDAFGTAHRAHASTEGIAHHVAHKAAGLLMQKELAYLGDAVNTPKRPLTAILGGSKISGKIDVITNLLGICDTILVGGGMMFTFLRAQGKEVGSSLVEAEKIDLAASILADAAARGVRLILPTDTVAATAFSADADRKTVSVDEIENGWMGLDIGPATAAEFSSVIRSSKTIVWNGPMGVFEMEPFSHGTLSVATALVEATRDGATTIIGGGDSAAAIAQFGMDKEVSHVSTGGGASLEFLEGKVLPGVAALAI